SYAPQNPLRALGLNLQNASQGKEISPRSEARLAHMSGHIFHSRSKTLAFCRAIHAERGRTRGGPGAAHGADHFERLLATAGVKAADIWKFASDAGLAEHQRSVRKMYFFCSLFVKGTVASREDDIRSKALHFDRRRPLLCQAFIERRERNERNRVYRVKPTPSMRFRADTDQPARSPQLVAQPLGNFLTLIDP